MQTLFWRYLSRRLALLLPLKISRSTVFSQRVLKSRGLTTAVGDEGGFAPDIADDEQAILLLLQAIEQAGYRPYDNFVLAIDAAASEWQDGNGGYCEDQFTETVRKLVYEVMLWTIFLHSLNEPHFALG